MGVVPRAAPGIPRVLASLARAPFVGDERGRGVAPSPPYRGTGQGLALFHQRRGVW